MRWRWTFELVAPGSQHSHLASLPVRVQVRMVVRNDRAFGDAQSDSDEEDAAGFGQEPGLLSMADIMPQCLLVAHWEEVAATLGDGSLKVQLLLDAPTVMA